MSIIVVAGAAGQVGSRLCSRLIAAGHKVTGIDRNPRPDDVPESLVWIRADLMEPELYGEGLKDADCVINCAGLAGKARPKDYIRENVVATRTLLNRAEDAGVKRFIYISSIAAKFKDRRHYAYADSRIAAEAVIKATSLRWTIVRPTMIFGPDSIVQANLAKLAKLPVTPIFGDGCSLIQPITSDDVVTLLVGLAEAGPEADGATIEAGGPEAFSNKNLLKRLRYFGGSKGLGHYLHLPLGILRQTLAPLEGALFAVLPFTSGQLAVFANDLVASPHPLMGKIVPAPTALSEAIMPTTDAPAPHAAPRLSRSEAAMTKEFRLFARYLTKSGGTDYQAQKYIDFHRRKRLEGHTAFDRFLLSVARSSGIGLWLADNYSGLLARQSVVRAKLVLTLGLLESAAPSFRELDAPDPGGRFAYVFMTLRGMEAGFGLLFGALLFLPVKIILGLLGKGGRSA